MDVSTYISTRTTVVLEPTEQWDLVSDHKGTVRVQRMTVHTNLKGDVAETIGIVVDGLRHKADGTVGKAPATAVYVYQSEMGQVPPYLLQAVRESVLAEVVEEGGHVAPWAPA